MNTIMTITGIRPDFIRMAAVFKKLDAKCDHILVHTGQHFDRMLSDIFFEELEIRKPDFHLQAGAPGRPHYEQLSAITNGVIAIAKRVRPDMIVFLGDSNSVLLSVPLAKEGFKIAHIEAGMRSGDRRMFEERNRVVCDHMSDLLFVYHENYRQKALREGIDDSRIHVVGNTIVEVCRPLVEELSKTPKLGSHILLDIHRPENFNDPARLKAILECANWFDQTYNLPVRMLSFHRTMREIEYAGISLGRVTIEPLMSYKQFLHAQYHAAFMISDSGTAQEEPALLKTPVLVPREYTERPESYEHDCSHHLDPLRENSWKSCQQWLDMMRTFGVIDPVWLGDGKTAERIVSTLESI